MNIYIKNLGLENFRVFKDKTDFEFAPITILTGTNSSGKSSLIKGLELLSNFYSEPDYSFLVSEQKECKNPAVLHDLMNLDFRAIARTKGDFTNAIHKSKGNKNKAVSLELKHYDYRLEKNLLINLSYEASDAKGFQNGKLSELNVLSDNLVGTMISVFSCKRVGGKFRFEINWRFFFEIYSEKYLIVKKLYESEEKKTQKDYAERQNLLNWFDVKKIADRSTDAKDFLQKLEQDKLVGKAYFDESQYPFFDIKKPFLKVHKVHANDKTWYEQWFDDTSSYLKENSYPDIVDQFEETSSGEDLIDQFLDQLNKLIAPDLGRSLMSSDMLVFYSNYTPDYQHSTPFFKMDKFRFYSSKNNNAHDKNKFDSYLNKYGLPISFSNDLNGMAAERFFSKFIFTSVANSIYDSVVKFQALTVLPAYRYHPFRSVHIDVPSSIVNYTERLVNLYLSATPSTQEEILNVLNEVMTLMELADEVDIRITPSKDSAFIMIKRGEDWYNISDQGFGVSSLFPVAMVLAMSNNQLKGLLKRGYEIQEYGLNSRPCILAIEEPEMNLHPKAASKLADTFYLLAKEFNTQFIIETHSEYLIRKLQYLTAKGDIKPEDTVIYYFYPPDDVPPGEDQVKKINIQEDGSLTDDFGSGFFDEADNIALELFLLKKSQHN